MAHEARMQRGATVSYVPGIDATGPVSGNENTLAEFDKIAKAQGWNDFGQLGMMRAFIEDLGLAEKFAEHAATIAKIENDGEVENNVENWFEDEVVQMAIAAAKVAWESERGHIGTDYELASAILNALTEMVIASTGLPVDVDSLRSRQRVYSTILGHDSVEDWFAGFTRDSN